MQKDESGLRATAPDASRDTAAAVAEPGLAQPAAANSAQAAAS
jgi:hypothetical protein